MKQKDVLELIQRHIDGSDSLRSLAREWGISAAYLSDVMLGRRYPGWKILTILGLEVRVVMQKTYHYTKRAQNGRRTPLQKKAAK